MSIGLATIILVGMGIVSAFIEEIVSHKVFRD